MSAITFTANHLGQRVEITLAMPANEEHAKYINDVYSQPDQEAVRQYRAKRFDEWAEVKGASKADIYTAFKSSWMAQILEDFSIVKN